MEQDSLSIANVCSGAVAELFQRELDRVLANIADVNTPADKTRKIQLTFVIHPYEDRAGAEIEFGCTSQLAPVERVEGRIFIGRRDGKLVAVPHDPRQPGLFTQPEEQSDKVTPISSATA